MRSPTDLPQRPPRRVPRARPAIIIAIVAVIVVLTSLRGIAGFWTDYLWFQNLGFATVFTGILGTKIVLALVFALIVFVVMLANLIIADQIGPRTPVGPQDELALRYREAVGRHGAKVRVAVAVIFALILGLGQQSQWNAWILYRNAQSFTQANGKSLTDPEFHKNIGYYVFKLPFLQNLVGWAFGTILVITFVTAVFHYLNGGIKLQTPNPDQRVSPQVKAHISLLLGILALIKGAGYDLQRYSLVDSTRGFVKGALYTDVHAQLPAFRLLMVISLIAFVLLIANIYLRGWTLPALGVGLWFLVSIAAGAIYPAIIQRYTVNPVEDKKEAPYIARNIAGTQAAYGLTGVIDSQFSSNNELTTADVESNAQTIRNIRLWDPDPSITPLTFSQLQSIRGYYRFIDTDVDRYDLGGQPTQTLLSVRELDQSSLPGGSSWVNEHLVYTHGYGAVLAPSNAVSSAGTPVFAIQNIPPSDAGSPSGTPVISTPQVYFGEATTNFSIVDTQQAELDYQNTSTGAPVTSHYTGAGGVKLSSLLRRAAFALRFSDLNVLISGAITNDSRILYVRDIQDRVQKAAPFLKLDADPYATILPDGRIVWVQDAYTTTDHYPYSEDYNDPGRLPANSGLNVAFNYIRNSAKVTVDAYDGTVTVYVTDQDDPIIRAYEKAFPKLFSKTPAPAALAAHFRYPEDLFSVQTDIWGRYHITDPNAFYQAGDAWAPAEDPGVGAATTPTTVEEIIQPNGRIVASGVKEQSPYYLEMTLPGDIQQSFDLIEPMVAVTPGQSGQQNMTAFMVAQSDPDDYGKIEVYHLPEGQRIPGPAQIDSLINQSVPVSQAISLLNTNGSQVLVGTVLTVPVDQSLLYIRPLYVSSKSNGAAVPELKKVIVVYNGQVYFENTLQEALEDAFPGLAQITQEQNVGQPSTLPTTNNGGSSSSSTTPTTAAPSQPVTSVPSGQTISQLLAEAQTDFTAADAALAKNPPDFATYETDIESAQALVAQAAKEAGVAGATASTSTTVAGSSSSSSTTAAPGSTTTVPTTTSQPQAATASYRMTRVNAGLQVIG
jgi:uncharacterized membrane protein (UPF0182 family)